MSSWAFKSPTPHAHLYTFRHIHLLLCWNYQDFSCSPLPCVVLMLCINSNVDVTTDWFYSSSAVAAIHHTSKNTSPSAFNSVFIYWCAYLCDYIKEGLRVGELWKHIYFFISPECYWFPGHEKWGPMWFLFSALMI